METTLRAGLTMAELQELATATYNMIEGLRRKLAAQGKMVWLNGVDNADPFVLPFDSNCSAPFGECGWGLAP